MKRRAIKRGVLLDFTTALLEGAADRADDTVGCLDVNLKGFQK